MIECCVEFITMISSEANDIAEKEAKKTIACEHVKTALEEFGFGNYVDEIMQVAADQRRQQAVRLTHNLPLCLGVANGCYRTGRRSKAKWNRAA